MSSAHEMELRRPSVNADAWGRYYTSNEVSRALINAMTGVRPKLVVELGAGECSLANAAHRKWRNASFVTVDTDVRPALPLAWSLGRAAHIHHAQDALDEELAERIGVPLGSADVGLCNPPYVRPRWRSSFGRILEDAGLSGALQSVHDAGADLLFIAQNLRLLRSGGKLGLILPDGLITAQKYLGVREVLLREHRVDLVVQLPRSAFAKTEAQTYLLVLSKRGGETQQVKLSMMSEGGDVSSPICVSSDLAKLRLDYAFHAASAKAKLLGEDSGGHSKLGDRVREVLRGSTCSSEIGDCSFPVFHLSDFPVACGRSAVPEVPANFILSSSDSNLLHKKYRIARAGDILIARIGRNLHEKVCVLSYGESVISDCIFAIRANEDCRDELVRYLLSSEGRAALAAASHGVGAKYLSRSDVLNLSLPF